LFEHDLFGKPVSTFPDHACGNFCALAELASGATPATAPADEDAAMRMGEIEIHDYARQMLDAYGDKAVVTAAQRAVRYEEKGQAEDAETWRHIESVLKLMRGPHAS
jgi:hypothetical protein